jgi:hypothetical protein
MTTASRPPDDTPPVGRCEWTTEHDPYRREIWDTTCGKTFNVIDDEPLEKWMNYCCFCGRALTFKRPVELTEDEHAFS